MTDDATGAAAPIWEHMRDFIRRTMVDEKTIDAGELALALPARTAEEALRLVREGLRAEPRNNP